MHTEHLRNVGIVRVVAGWLVAVAIASLSLLAALGTGLIPPEANTGGWAAVLAILIGFAAGGFIAGFLALRAPILHGIAIGLTSLVAASAFALINGIATPGTRWTDMRAGAVVILVLLQFLAAVVGALLGYNIAIKGKPGLGEPDAPEEIVDRA
jgi:hypothetical protein